MNEKSYTNMLIYVISYKVLIYPKHLHKIDGLIRTIYDGTRDLVLFDH